MFLLCLFLCSAISACLSVYIARENHGIGCFVLSIAVGLFMVAGLIFVDKESPTQSVRSAAYTFGAFVLDSFFSPTQIARAAAYTSIERPEFVTQATVHARVKALASYCTEYAAKDPQASALVLEMGQFFSRAYLPGEKEAIVAMLAVQDVSGLCAKQVGVVQDPLSTVR